MHPKTLLTKTNQKTYATKKAQVPFLVYPGTTGLSIAFITRDRQRCQPTPARLSYTSNDLKTTAEKKQTHYVDVSLPFARCDVTRLLSSWFT